MKVIFVCHGNTCRSPMAEAIFKSLTDNIEVTSAGISSFSGEKASPNAVKVCEYYNLDIKQHRSRSFYDLEIGADDLILALTCDIRDKIRETYPDMRVYVLKEYAGETEYLDVPDPIGASEERYEYCYHEIREALVKIVKKMLSN